MNTHTHKLTNTHTHRPSRVPNCPALSPCGRVLHAKSSAVSCWAECPEADRTASIRSRHGKPRGTRWASSHDRQSQWSNLRPCCKAARFVVVQTLSDFIVRNVASFPADNYALILWDHGSSCASPSAARSGRVVALAAPSLLDLSSQGSPTDMTLILRPLRT